MLQIIALHAPGITTFRVWLHRARGVKLGRNISIGTGALIETAYPHLVAVGNNVEIGIRAVLIAHFGDLTPDKSKPTICIEDDVFIGPGAIVLPDVKIEQGSVVTAGSVVNQSVPSRTVVQGNPAKAVARCKAPLAWNSYAEFVKGLEPIRRTFGDRKSPTDAGSGTNSASQRTGPITEAREKNRLRVR